jgi:hypothetical protein
MIDFQPTIDVTPVIGTHYFQEYRDKGQTAFLADSPASILQTDFGGRGIFAILRGSTGTATSLERQQLLNSVAIDPCNQLERSEIEAASEVRLTLLAQKYEGTSTKEDNARLAILTQRIRRLSPRITVDDLAVMTVVTDGIEKISADIEELRAEFDI